MIQHREVMKLRLTLVYAISACGLIWLILLRFGNLKSWSSLLLGIRIVVGVLLFAFGALHVYSGVWLKKVTIIGRYGAYDTYSGKAARIQGVLAGIFFFSLGLFLMSSKKIFVYFLLVPFILMIFFHFIFPPRK